MTRIELAFSAWEADVLPLNYTRGGGAIHGAKPVDLALPSVRERIRRPFAAWWRSARRLLPGEPVDRFPEEVGMAVVPRVLLDHVEQDPAQAGASAVR